MVAYEYLQGARDRKIMHLIDGIYYYAAFLFPLLERISCLFIYASILRAMCPIKYVYNNSRYINLRQNAVVGDD